MNSGNPSAASKTKTVKFSDRDWKILRHVGKFGFSLFEIIHTLYFKGKARDAVKSTLRRLCGKGPTYRFLRPVPLYGSRVAYQLTHRGAAAVGVSPSRARKVGVQARVERFAMVRFIHDIKGKGDRTLMTNAKLREHFSLGGHRLPRQRFFIEDRMGDSYLGFIVVDHGGYERRIVRKAVDFLHRFLRHGWFDDYLRAGRFVLTVLTLNDFKAKAIAYGLKKLLRKKEIAQPLAALHPPYHGKWPLPVDIVVIPGLINLIPGKAIQPARRRR